MNVFLTGGTGYLGLRLASALRSAGHAVTGLSRSPAKSAPLDALGVETVIGDVTGFDAVDVDLAAFDAVIHSAALVKTKAKDPLDFDRVNVEGVANVARRALEAGVPKFLYTSSFMALGPSSGTKSVHESDVHDPSHIHNDYERTKFLGLAEFDRWVERGLPGVALFPAVIYGPGSLTSGNITAQAISDVVRGKLPGILGDGKRTWTYSYVEDVVEGHLKALLLAKPPARYILGGESLTMEGFVKMVADIAGVEAPSRHIPFWLAKVGALAEEVKSAVTGNEPKLTREVVEIYKHDWEYCSRKARDELAYRVTPLRNGLAQTVSWVKMQIEHGKLK